MCDCYSEPCKGCGKKIPMHLGDFDTQRFEIFAVCEKCLGNEYAEYKPERLLFSSVLWGSKEGKVLVVALTDTAWQNRKMNHPNISGTEIIEEFENA